MLRDRQARGHIVTYVMLVAASLLLLAFSDSRPLRDLRGGVNFALAPVQEALSDGARSVGSLFTAVAEIDQLRHDNRTLTQRVSDLEQANLQIPAMIIENQRLSELLKLKSSFDHKTVAAAVVYSDSTGAERVITLDKGSDDGIFLNATVVAPGGALAGQVQEVGRNYANSPAHQRHPLQRHRAGYPDRRHRRRPRQPVGAAGHAECDRHQGHRCQVTPSSRPVTSKALGSQFPRNIVIGRIIEVHQDPASIVTHGPRGQPAANLDSIESRAGHHRLRAPALPGATPPPDVGPTPAPDQATPAATRPRKTPKH